MSPEEKKFEEEARRRANQYGNKAGKLIDGIREEMWDEIRRENIREYERRTGKGW